MMRTLYDVLEISQTATTATLQSIYEIKAKALQQCIDDGNADAVNELWALKEAYTVLANPIKRAEYDKKLADKQINDPQHLIPIRITKKRIFNWKLAIIAIVLLGGGLIGMGIQMEGDAKIQKNKSEALLIQMNAGNISRQLDNQETHIYGTLKNEDKSIDVAGKVANRIVDVYQQSEERANRELEYRENAGLLIVEIEKEKEKEKEKERQRLGRVRQQTMLDYGIPDIERQLQVQMQMDRQHPLWISYQTDSDQTIALRARLLEARMAAEQSIMLRTK